MGQSAGRGVRNIPGTLRDTGRSFMNGIRGVSGENSREQLGDGDLIEGELVDEESSSGANGQNGENGRNGQNGESSAGEFIC